MLAGHELPEVETVVERCNGYVIVEKRDEAGEHADDTDPRRRGAGQDGPERR